ncbi:MAG: hypothetical protein HY585_00355 [Candidatus Omnitrophica bacterium]|nr:hypothetical protein [Candidatus Omnitrophota bacterium]
MKKQRVVLITAILILSGLGTAFSKSNIEEVSESSEQLLEEMASDDQNRRISELARSITNLERRIDRLDDRFERLDNDLKELKRKV